MIFVVHVRKLMVEMNFFITPTNEINKKSNVHVYRGNKAAIICTYCVSANADRRKFYLR